MPIAPPTRYGFRISGIAPARDAVWARLGAAQRKAYHSAAAGMVLDLYDAQCAAGLDRFGAPLSPVSAYTREHRRSAMGHADPDAPPLTPAHDASRTRSYVRARADESSVLVYWRHDPRVKSTWGRILYFHSRGAVRGGKVRDVLGLAPKALDALKRTLKEWWDKNRTRLLRAALPPSMRDQAEAIARGLPRGNPRRGKTAAVHPPEPEASAPKGPPPRSRPSPVLKNLDIDKLTFHSEADETAVRQAIASGTFSGFRRDFGPRPPGPPFGKPPRPPAPRPPEAPPVHAAPVILPLPIRAPILPPATATALRRAVRGEPAAGPLDAGLIAELAAIQDAAAGAGYTADDIAFVSRQIEHAGAARTAALWRIVARLTRAGLSLLMGLG